MTEHEMTTAQKAMSLLRTFVSTVRTMKTYASAEVVGLRLTICENCPTDRYDNGRCTRCTCEIKTKTKFANTTCPDNHWGCEIIPDK